MPGNAACADCGAAHPTWASLNLGVLVCLACSGAHRLLGVHVSRVRSLELDAWSPVHVAVLAALGNARAAAVWGGAMPAAAVATAPAARAAFIADKCGWLGLFLLLFILLLLLVCRPTHSAAPGGWSLRYVHRRFMAPAPADPAAVLRAALAADARVDPAPGLLALAHCSAVRALAAAPPPRGALTPADPARRR
jgi:hypothetical protein